MELSTRSQVKQIFSSFPSGNENELITKSELSSGTSGLLTTDSFWKTSECIPVSAIIPVRAYFCNSTTDKYPINTVRIYRGEGEERNRLYLSRPFSTLNITRLQVLGVDQSLNLNPSPDTASFQIVTIFVFNRGAYWEFSMQSGPQRYTITMTMDGVQIILNLELI